MVDLEDQKLGLYVIILKKRVIEMHLEPVDLETKLQNVVFGADEKKCFQRLNFSPH